MSSCASLIIFCIAGVIFYKKSPSVFIEMENILALNELFKYIFGRTPKQTMKVLWTKNNN